MEALVIRIHRAKFLHK